MRRPGPIDEGPLELIDRPRPEPGPHEVRVRVLTCGVCRTDLHLAEGDLAPHHAATVPGHEIVGRIDQLGAGEAPGTWRGAAVDRLGLAGEVDGDTLGAILGRHLPGHDTPLPGGGQRRIPGWDLTFSAPKSVSVLFGLTDPDIARQVTAAHEAAVDESLAYLERWALASRRRQAGEIIVEAGQGMIVAAFRHRTSRAGDPQLHTHALMANAVQRADDSWGAVDSRIIYRQARSAGFVYQAVLRSQLTERLGVRWSNVDKRGIAELADIPETARTRC